MLGNTTLPEGLVLSRTTNTFDKDSVPKGLLRAHRIAEGSWGVLRVVEGELLFVIEESGESRMIRAGEAQVVEPGVLHHIEVEEGARFLIEFHKKPE